jgi:hypothetical protein
MRGAYSLHLKYLFFQATVHGSGSRFTRQMATRQQKPVLLLLTQEGDFMHIKEQINKEFREYLDWLMDENSEPGQ